MSNNIEKIQSIKIENLDKEYFFKSLIEQLCNLNLLKESDLENIQINSIKLLEKQIKRFTSGESSSVPIETAQNILISIFYIISVYLKQIKNIDFIIQEIKENNLNKLFDKGKIIIKQKIKKSEILLKMAKEDALLTNNIAYNDTIVKNGLSSFFVNYDSEFYAHYTMGSIDYPLCVEKIETTGVEYIYEYILRIYIENKFCSQFKQDDIELLMKGYDKNYKNLLVNIFECVFTNVLGSIILNKDLYNINITNLERQYLKNYFSELSEISIYNSLKEAVNNIFIEMNIKNSFMKQYLISALKKITLNIKNSFKNNNFHLIFITFYDNEFKSKIEYKYNSSLDNELFRNIVDEIIKCKYVKDKIKIIKNNIKNIFDLIDIFETDCIYQSEYSYIFDELDESEIALILNISSLILKDLEINLTDENLQWEIELFNYINGLEKTKIKNIELFLDKISVD